jgi:hypothetical protein
MDQTTTEAQYLLPTTTGPLSTPKAKRGGMPLWAWPVIALMGLATVVVAVVASTVASIGSKSPGPPSGTIASFYDALVKHQYEQAYSYLTPELAQADPPDVLKARWEVAEGQIGTITATDEPRTGGNSNEAYVTALVEGGGKQYALHLRLDLQNGVWKIAGGQPAFMPVP